MEKLMDHTLKRQLDEQKQETTALREQMAEMTSMMHQLITTPEATQPHQVQHNTDSVVNNGPVLNQNIQINVFGKESTEHVTRRRVNDLLLPLLAYSAPDAAVQALLQAALLIYSDAEHPENITCYLPNKKRKEALVYSSMGWEVQPISLVLPPMMQSSVDLLFDKQPVTGLGDTPEDADMDACGRILKELQAFEKDPTKARQVAGPEGTLKAVLVRNKEQLARVLKKLPIPGTKNDVVPEVPELPE